MGNYKIQNIFEFSYEDFCVRGHFQSDVQQKAARAIMKCKSGALGCNVSRCDDCGYTEFHNNSCRNRNCPDCQAVLKEIWVDKRRSKVIDSPYFHVVFTLPHELNPLIYYNQKLLYDLLHKFYNEEELDELSTCRKFRHVRKEGKREMLIIIRRAVNLLHFLRWFKTNCIMQHMGI